MVRLFEEKGALVRIPVAGKVCAYALDPHEVWKGYNTSKDYSAFCYQDVSEQRWRNKTPNNGYVFWRGELSRAVAKRLLTARNDPADQKDLDL